jgi:transcriptional regulator with XRE-family HTH domain
MDFSQPIRWGFKRAVADKGLTVVELAERAGVNRTYLSMYGRGRYNLNAEELARVANVLGVHVSEIQGGQGDY